MNKPRLAPCLIGNGTLSDPRDMMRALETLEGLEFTQEVDGKVMAEGRATLVKLMADDSSTILVNGCLFLNVTSFRHLTFSTTPCGQVTFMLVGDGMTLTLVPVPEPDRPIEEPVPMRLLDESAFDPESYVTLDDDEDEAE